jgi:transposase
VAAGKKSRHADERETARVPQARAAAPAELAALDAARVKCIDESGVTRAMPRLYGRAPRGERGVGTVPQTYGAHVTRLAALGSHGIAAVLTLDGAPEAAGLRVDVEQGLRPTRPPGDIVIMDNLRAHQAAGRRAAIEQTGARLQSLPPSSPDWSPLEPCWSQLQTALRTAKARPREALEHASAEALATITVSDAHSWFRHGGDALQ